MQTSLLLLATSLQNGPMGQAMQRGDFGRGGHGHGFGFFPLLMLIALALLGVWIWRNWNGRNNFVEATANAMHGGADRFKSAFTSTPGVAQNALQVLQTRYASGELSRDEYLTMRADLAGDAPTASAAPGAAAASDTDSVSSAAPVAESGAANDPANEEPK